jgi:hypothetical protein
MNEASWSASRSLVVATLLIALSSCAVQARMFHEQAAGRALLQTRPGIATSRGNYAYVASGLWKRRGRVEVYYLNGGRSVCQIKDSIQLGQFQRARVFNGNVNEISDDISWAQLWYGISWEGLCQTIPKGFR